MSLSLTPPAVAVILAGDGGKTSSSTKFVAPNIRLVN
jgi:hypothetical protein